MRGYFYSCNKIHIFVDQINLILKQPFTYFKLLWIPRYSNSHNIINTNTILIVKTPKLMKTTLVNEKKLWTILIFRI